jgi:hypothetical protein
MAPDLPRESRSRHNFSSALRRYYQQTVFLAGQGKHLAVQYHEFPAQVNVQMSVSHPFAASDYLRATGTSGTLFRVKVEELAELAQSWISSGFERPYSIVARDATISFQSVSQRWRHGREKISRRCGLSFAPREWI